LPQASKAALAEKITEITLPKACVILKAGKVETNIYFIRRGIVRLMPRDGHYLLVVRKAGHCFHEKLRRATWSARKDTKM